MTCEKNKVPPSARKKHRTSKRQVILPAGCDCRVLRHRSIAEKTYLLRVERPQGIDIKPGQFCEIQIPGFYLRRPISICDFSDESITMIYKVMGKGTEKLTGIKGGEDVFFRRNSDMVTGETLNLITGLGNGFNLPSTDCTPILIGGGVGIPPLYALAKKLLANGFKPRVFLGFNQVREVFLVDEFRELGIDVAVSTVDGRAGTQGTVITLLEEAFGSTEDLNDKYLYACGPLPMLRALYAFAQKRNIDGQMSLEERMGCGFGACVGCTIQTHSGPKKICTDGPVFNLAELDWQDVISDQNTATTSAQSSSGSTHNDLSIKTLSTEQSSNVRAKTPTRLKELSKHCLKTSLCGIELSNPVIPASGTFGFGYEFAKYFDLNILGSMSLKGTTISPRFGNPTPRIAEYNYGLLNAVGLQNPGVDEVIANEIPKLQEYFYKPAIANISGFSIEDYVSTAQKFDREPSIGWLEINISCPNVHAGGMSFGTSCESAASIVREIKVACRKPLIVKLSPNVTDIVAIAASCAEAGADAICLINTLLGMRLDLKRRRPIIANRTGGVSGPGVFPVALRMVYDVYKALRMPVVGVGGISSAYDVIEMMMAGACAVQIGSANLVDPLACPKIIADLPEVMHELNIDKLTDIIGAAIE